LFYNAANLVGTTDERRLSMFRSLRLVSFLSFAALAAVSTACRDTGSGDDTNIDAPGPDSTQGGLTIPEIHADAMVPGTPVDLKGKVVVAIDNFGARKGNFWIAEEAGGEFSGVLVFGAPVDQVALLAVGDKVDISGAEKVEFALTADTSGRTTTELQPVSGGAMTVTKVGTGTVPAPHIIDAAILSNMDEATRYAEYEKWEGVGETSPGHRRATASRASPAWVDYFFNWKILPTHATSDIECHGVAPATVENTDGAVHGHRSTTTATASRTAWTDFACTGRSRSCTTSTTIAMVQTGVVPANVPVW
jgi:hypothetical protein